MKTKTKNIALLALLSALAVVISLLEGLFAGLLPPGVKPGFSNLIVMTSAVWFGFPAALAISAFKSVFALLTRGTLAFVMSLAGGLFSALCTSLLLRFARGRLGFVGISVLGAEIHNLAQFTIAYGIIGYSALFYLPILISTAVACGTVTGIVLSVLLPFTQKHMNRRDCVSSMKNEVLTFPKRPYRQKGGVRLPHLKATHGKESVLMPSPSEVILPMSMHIGAPCRPTVKVGERVLVGQKVGDSDAYVSAPIHASVSGTVKEIRPFLLSSGVMGEAVVIASDGLMEAIDAVPPTVTDAASLAAAARECGLVGLGGAGFPTHVKLSVPNGKSADTLLINAAECEPYLTADNQEALENSWDVLSGIYAIKEILGIHRVIIGVEKNKPEAIEILRRIAESEMRDAADEVRVLPLPESYPQGAEKVLIRSCTGREVPQGKLPLDVGCIVMNLTSVAVLSRYLKTGMPLVSKRVTVDGNAVSDPKNVIAPIGTKIADLLAFVGVEEEYSKVLYGGPMMGFPVASLDQPILKNTNGIVVLKGRAARSPEPTACIRCGRCIDACPMGLSPLKMERAVLRKDGEALNGLSLASCMECGCCAYGCPAKRPLVQAFRLGKQMLREMKK